MSKLNFKDEIMKNRNNPIQDNWMTPPDLYEKWNKKYHFDFDPCPFNHNLDHWDGLIREWGDMNFVNPPYSQKTKEAFITIAATKSIFSRKDSFMLLPVSTSTVIYHGLMKRASRHIEFLEGRIHFIGINSKGQYVNYHQLQETTKETIEYEDPKKGLIEIPRFIKGPGQFDSMTVLF